MFVWSSNMTVGVALLSALLSRMHQMQWLGFVWTDEKSLLSTPLGYVFSQLALASFFERAESVFFIFI